MKPVNQMTVAEQDIVLRLAKEIQAERERQKKFNSLNDSTHMMIRWSVPYTKYNVSHYSVDVSVEDVKDLLEAKILGENYQ